MEKQLILLDFDKTLFNVKTFFEDFLFPALEREFNINRETFEDISKEYRESLTKSTQFNPSGWVEVAKRHFDIDPEAYFSILNTPEFYAKSLYPEVIPTLAELSHDYVLGIYSEAVKEWQIKKISLSGIINYFDQNLIMIREDKVSDLVIDNIPAGAIVVDDKMEVIAALKRKVGIYPIWINRAGIQGIPSLREIRDLSQLLRMAEKIRGEILQLNSQQA